MIPSKGRHADQDLCAMSSRSSGIYCKGPSLVTFHHYGLPVGTVGKNQQSKDLGSVLVENPRGDSPLQYSWRIKMDSALTTPEEPVGYSP